jgi:hypothetical protein
MRARTHVPDPLPPLSTPASGRSIGRHPLGFPAAPAIAQAGRNFDFK